jgi:hypothetical protein
MSRSWGRSCPAAGGGRSEAVRGRGLGWDYVHAAVDDHSRLAYAGVLPDERATTCAGFLHRACAWLHQQHDVTVRRVQTDNAKAYRVGADWAAVCGALQIKRRFIKHPHQPPHPVNNLPGRYN